MIASVAGQVSAVHLDGAVLEVGGVGLMVHATPGTLAELRVGQQARLATTLVVREESLTLFGFVDTDERDAFETLQTVSGVGPRLALAMLAVHRPDGLRRAVAEEDLAALQRVPGIGRKGAQRIVLELGDRLGSPGTQVAGSPTVAGGGSAGRDKVVQALIGLGWNARQAGEAVTALSPESDPGPADESEVAALLRGALASLGRR